MRRRISALVLTAVMAGTGAALVTAPTAQAASFTCDIAQLRHDAAVLKQEAARQKRAGQREAARRTLAKSDALYHRAQQCEDLDRNTSHHF
ncbi:MULTISPECIES: hypothetical protein [Streptomyces]|uniref:DUF1090 family protein n=3 Tax=Streptomyces TaxID=1883 RepID=A0A3S9PLP6_STRLT|nr:hypothetical protein [Streptomyces luteoverticillatus]AZQ73266.1 hypothetical protein EKH77_20445 [Streptomyces luteoverticillatus]